MKTGLQQCLSKLPTTLSKISINDLTAKLPFPETFYNVSSAQYAQIYLVIFVYRVFTGEFVELYFISFQSSLLLKFLRSSAVINLKEPLFERALSIPNNI